MIEDQLKHIRAKLKSGEFPNEAAVSLGVVLPILHELKWPVFDTAVVAPEYALQGRRVDYALIGPSGKPSVFLEVKRLGFAEGAERQLFDYASVLGVRLAVLTDGQEWSFYLPGEEGHYDERRIYKLDLLERTIEDAAERFTRYLDFERTRSGAALEAARADHQDVSRGRQIESALPRAWDALLKDQDEALLELLADKVEDISGMRPNFDTISRFMTTVAGDSAAYGAPPTAGARSTPISNSSTKAPSTRASVGASPGFTFQGKRRQSGSAIEVLKAVLRTFAEADSTFLQRFAARKHGRKRRYLAQNRLDLYPDRPDLAENYADELIDGSGWWVGTNYSKSSIRDIVELAAEVAGIAPDSLALGLG